MKIKEEEFSHPTSKKRVQPTNVGNKGKKPKNVVTKKEELFSKFNEEKGNGMKCKFF